MYKVCIRPLETGSTLVCGYRYSKHQRVESRKHFLKKFSEKVKECFLGSGSRRGNISNFSRNFEAFASELLENLEEMFPLHYIHNYTLVDSNMKLTLYGVTRI